MDTTILAALVAGVAAIIAAIISAIVAIRAVKVANKANKELAAYEIWGSVAREQIEERARTLGEVCRGLQEIRENIRLFQEDRNATNFQSLSAAARNFVGMYGATHFRLDDIERRILHDSKAMVSHYVYARNKRFSDVESSPLLYPKIIDGVFETMTQAHTYFLNSYENISGLLARMPSDDRLFDVPALFKARI